MKFRRCVLLVCTIILLGVAGYGIYHKYFDRYNMYTPEIIAEGSGITLPEYEVLSKSDDRDLLEDGWGQVVWLVKVKRPISNKLLDELVKTDNRWTFQDDVRQQYLFDENLYIANRTIYIGKGNDPIISLSYEWEK